MARIFELYKLSASSGEEYRWNNIDIPIEYLSEIYSPIAIRRSSFSQEKELNKANMKIFVPLENPLVSTLMSGSYDGYISVTVFRKIEEVYYTHWKGRVVGITGISDNQCTIECENLFTSMRRTGGRARYQKQCRHALYGTGCGVSKASYGIPTSVLAITGNDVTVQFPNTPPPGETSYNSYYVGGILEYNGDYRFISGQSANRLSLWRKFPALEDVLNNSQSTDPNQQITTWSHTATTVEITTAGNHGIAVSDPIRIDNLWYLYKDPTLGIAIENITYDSVSEEITVTISTDITPYHGLSVLDTVEITNSEYTYVERSLFLSRKYKDSTELNGIYIVKEVLSSTSFKIDFISETLDSFVSWKGGNAGTLVGSSDGLNPEREKVLNIPFETYPNSVTPTTVVLNYVVGVNSIILTRVISPNPNPSVDYPTISVRNLAVGQVFIYPGCNRTLMQCETRFNNSINFGGFPWIPVTNPFNPVNIW